MRDLPNERFNLMRDLPNDSLKHGDLPNDVWQHPLSQVQEREPSTNLSHRAVYLTYPHAARA